jgi:hypothetical protein
VSFKLGWELEIHNGSALWTIVLDQAMYMMCSPHSDLGAHFVSVDNQVANEVQQQSEANQYNSNEEMMSYV